MKKMISLLMAAVMMLSLAACGGSKTEEVKSADLSAFYEETMTAIMEEKGEVEKINTKECLIDIRIDAHIPESYIESLPHRLSIYKRIADIKNEEDASDVIDELIDRFGEPPASVEGLVKVALMRNLAAGLGIYEIGQNNNSLLLYVEQIDMKKVAVLVKAMRGRILVSTGPKPYITVKKASGQTPLDALKEALDLLSQAQESEKKENEV